STARRRGMFFRHPDRTLLGTQRPERHAAQVRPPWCRRRPAPPPWHRPRTRGPAPWSSRFRGARGSAPCRFECARHGSRSAPSGRQEPRAPTPNAKPGIRSSRGSRPVARQGRRLRGLPGTSRPAPCRRHPRWAAGSWWRRERKSGGRASSPVECDRWYVRVPGTRRSRHAKTFRPAWYLSRPALAYDRPETSPCLADPFLRTVSCEPRSGLRRISVPDAGQYKVAVATVRRNGVSARLAVQEACHTITSRFAPTSDGAGGDPLDRRSPTWRP